MEKHTRVWLDCESCHWRSSFKLGVWMTVSQSGSVRLSHLNSYLIKGRQGPGPGDDGVDEAGGDVPPLPSLLLVAGGGWRDEDTSQEVDKEEGCGSRENSAGH